VPERIVTAVIALAVAVGFAVSLTAARAEDRLNDLQFRPPKLDEADLRRADQLERDAGRLTPGVRRAIVLSGVRLRGGDAAGALEIASAAARQEPENAEAWLAVARAAGAAGVPIEQEARQRLRELVPPVPEP
jgi:hypothetical protein